jgi:hypothetical protein
MTKFAGTDALAAISKALFLRASAGDHHREFQYGTDRHHLVELLVRNKP